ncbi:MAG: hypothetical protein ACRD88_02370 [Terriglobia bacterium]
MAKGSLDQLAVPGTVILFLAGSLLLAVPPAQGQTGSAEPSSTSAARADAAPAGERPNIPEIIRRFAEKEKEFRAARDSYSYHQVVKVQTLSPEGQVTGTHQLESDIILTPSGDRVERVTYAPLSTLRGISLSPEDERDLKSIQPFVLTIDELHKYNIEYMGRQKVDELDTFVFMVGPKRLEKGERYFQGQIWVDDHDFQIVKTYGKAVPDIRQKGGENLFPRFETYRQQIDGKYWFPTWTGADDTLYFSSGSRRIKMLVRYENYKRFGTEVKVNLGVEVPPTTPQP